MKSIVLFIVLILTGICHSQISYSNLNLEYETSIPKLAETDSVDIDSDGLVDLQISSWFIYENLFEDLGIGVLVKDHDDDFSTTITSIGVKSSGIVRDCHTSGTNNIYGYVYSNNYNSGIINYTSGYLKIPFDFEASDGIHCGFLFVRYNGSLVTIEGYSWNETKKSSGGQCPCNNDYLSLSEPISSDTFGEVDKYFDLLGKEIKDPHGFVIVLYKNGITKKVFFE